VDTYGTGHTYILIVYLRTARTITVGRLGRTRFHEGLYLYVGSGGTSPLMRLRRHILRTKKKFWHIDYLTSHAKVIGAIIMDSHISLECHLARRLRDTFTPIPGFGSSDCRCGSHLFFAGPKVQ
jgi:sugar fermentation stimulation protein A